MSRLRHTLSGFFRKLQIHDRHVFAFVEGNYNDSFFFGNICESVCKSRNLSYQILRAEELPVQAGGKEALVQFYKIARSRKSLIIHFTRKSSVLIFFLDKDVDDILRKMCRSDHVIYTRYYDIENHLFLNANFERAVAATCSRDETEIRSLPLFQNNWCHNAAVRWKEWVTLCLICMIKGIALANYRNNSSSVNIPRNGPVDPNAFEDMKNRIISALGCSDEEFDDEYSKVAARVDKIYRQGRQDIIFKGKWYPSLLENDLVDYYSPGGIRVFGIKRAICKTLAATLDFSDQWAKHFTDKIEKVLEKLD